MHGAPGTSLALCHSSSHVTSRKHWHTGRHILSLCPLFLPRLNRRFFLLIQFKNWQSETTRLRVWHKKEKEFPVLTASKHSHYWHQCAAHHAVQTVGEFSRSQCQQWQAQIFSLCFHSSVLAEWVIENIRADTHHGLAVHVPTVICQTRLSRLQP